MMDGHVTVVFNEESTLMGVKGGRLHLPSLLRYFGIEAAELNGECVREEGNGLTTSTYTPGSVVVVTERLASSGVASRDSSSSTANNFVSGKGMGYNLLQSGQHALQSAHKALLALSCSDLEDGAFDAAYPPADRASSADSAVEFSCNYGGRCGLRRRHSSKTLQEA